MNIDVIIIEVIDKFIGSFGVLLVFRIIFREVGDVGIVG